MRTVFIVPNLRKKGIAEAVDRVCKLIFSYDGVAMMPWYASAMVSDPRVRFVEDEVGAREADFIISLGGDGTILRIADLASRYETPLLGVNLGHLGFITALEADEIEMIGRVFEGKYRIDQRMMLAVSVERNGELVFTGTALNEVMLTKLNPSKIIRIKVEADRTPVIHFRGDGLIIATPTGTTAYSHSAGGPIIEPTAENIALTPVCPFTGTGKSFVFSPSRILAVRASAMDGGGACISTDGDQPFDLRPDDVVYIKRANAVTRLITVKDCSFYDILREKLSDGGID